MTAWIRGMPGAFRSLRWGWPRWGNIRPSATAPSSRLVNVHEMFYIVGMLTGGCHGSLRHRGTAIADAVRLHGKPIPAAAPHRGQDVSALTYHGGYGHRTPIPGAGGKLSAARTWRLGLGLIAFRPPWARLSAGPGRPCGRPRPVPPAAKSLTGGCRRPPGCRSPHPGSWGLDA